MDMKMSKYEKVMDILDKWEFFYGQKAGRDLWADKPFDIQMKDLMAFNRDIATVREYINAHTTAEELIQNGKTLDSSL